MTFAFFRRRYCATACDLRIRSGISNDAGARREKSRRGLIAPPKTRHYSPRSNSISLIARQVYTYTECMYVWRARWRSPGPRACTYVRRSITRRALTTRNKRKGETEAERKRGKGKERQRMEPYTYIYINVSSKYSIYKSMYTNATQIA